MARRAEVCRQPEGADIFVDIQQLRLQPVRQEKGELPLAALSAAAETKLHVTAVFKVLRQIILFGRGEKERRGDDALPLGPFGEFLSSFS